MLLKVIFIAAICFGVAACSTTQGTSTNSSAQNSAGSTPSGGGY
jgi:hypothetical protein